MVKVEYKVKHTLGVAWEDITPVVTVEIASKRTARQQQLADKIGIAIARGENAIEVRWNLKGSYQGHYCGRYA